MRLVTFDRRGHRRLGAVLGGEVVDLPDLVGHPAFPTTMEALVSSNGGTVMDAARAALERDEADGFVVKPARLLPPIVPRALRGRGLDAVDRSVLGPDDAARWPSGAGWVEYEPKIAVVLGRPLHGASAAEAGEAVFGYTLINDWVARGANGDPVPASAGLGVALGPSIVTIDELDPQTTMVTAAVDGEQWNKGNLNGTARVILEEIALASRMDPLDAGDIFAMSAFGQSGAGRELWPGATVELEAEGIGTLRNRLGELAGRSRS